MQNCKPKQKCSRLTSIVSLETRLCLALHVWRHWVPGMKEKMFPWRMVCQLFGVSRKITLMMAIFVSMTLLAVLQQRKRNTLFTQVCNQEYTQHSTQKIYLCPNLQIKKCRVPSVLINIPVVNMWSPMIQKIRINQYHFLKSLYMTCAGIFI